MAVTVGFIRAIGIETFIAKYFKVAPKTRIFAVKPRARIFKSDRR